MGFITKNYYKGKLDFLNYYGFEYKENGYCYYSHNYEETDGCWISKELCDFDEIVVIINETGTKVTVDISNINWKAFAKRQTFEIHCSTDDEKEYIENLDEIVTTYLEEQGYDCFHNIDNRH